MSLYILFALICLVIFVFHNWYIGKDLDIGSLSAMFVGSLFPVANVLVLIYVLFDLLYLMLKKDNVLLKGKK
jgi:hypothetical protein